MQRHLQQHVAREVADHRAVRRGLDHQRQHVEPAGRGRRRPAQRADGRRETDVARIADDGGRAGRSGVTRVADELLVPDPGAGAAGRVRREHADQGTDAATVGRGPQVLGALGRDIGRAMHVPQVADLQAAPVQAADAAGAVAPGHPGAEGELEGGVAVGAGGADLGPYLGEPRTDRPGGGVFGVVQPQEVFRFGEIDHLTGRHHRGSSRRRHRGRGAGHGADRRRADGDDGVRHEIFA